MSREVALLGLVWICAASPAAALPVTYTKIADSSTLRPGSTFDAFFAPAVDAGVVAFRAWDTDDTGDIGDGIYMGSGGALTTVVDDETPLPGGDGTFHGSGDPSISAGNVAFVGNENDSAFGLAVYSTLNGTLGVVADSSTLDPDDGGAIQPLGFSPSIDGQNVAFTGLHSSGLDRFYTQVAGVLETSASLLPAPARRHADRVPRLHRDRQWHPLQRRLRRGCGDCAGGRGHQHPDPG
jgi:hypothetical protein